MSDDPSAPLQLDPDSDVSLEAAHRVAAHDRPVALSDRAVVALERARARLESWIEEGRRIYGVTTGFGPLADTVVDPEHRRTLQENLVYHLSTGVGDPMSRRQVRAVMIARAVSLSRGHSAIRPDSLRRLLALLNRDLRPLVPSLGTVGASGDLTPLAHIALALMGDGEMLDGGEPRDADQVLAEANLEPLDLDAKEGLALVNGTSAMTGLAVLNAVDAVRAADTALRISLLYAECLGARTEAWAPLLGRVRPHPGQKLIHRRLEDWSASSDRLDGRRTDRDRPAAGSNEPPVQPTDDLPQDRYSIRCLPQLYGAVLDSLWQHNDVVDNELNAVSDNPVLDPEAGGMVHGGNFYGQHVAFASDQLANAVLTIGIHLERCVERLTNPESNGDLPAFLQDRAPGLHSGLMGAQVTATSLVAEMRSRSTPASTQSIPTNADNQDVVTMGTIGARRTAEHLDRLWELIAIAGLTVARALELTDADREAFSATSQRLSERVREASPPLEGDRPLSNDIARLADLLRAGPAELPLRQPPS